MREKFDGFRRRLSEKPWFRLAAEGVFGRKWLTLLLGLLSLLFLLPLAAPEIKVPGALQALGGVSYLLLLPGQLILGLDVYEEESRRHLGNFFFELALLVLLLLAGRFGMLEQAAAFLF